MATHQNLFEIVRPHLHGINKARLQFLCKIILGLIGANTICHEYLSRHIATKSKLSSVYRGIQRFFAGFEIDAFTVARLVASLVPIGELGWILTMDRTNWKFGKKNINLLVLGVACEGVAIPLFSTLLDKRGNSNWKERIDVLSRFVECFGKDPIECFTADREFIGNKWLGYLKSENIPVCVRTKENIHIADRNGEPKPGRRMFSSLAVGEYSILRQRETMGIVFDIVGCRLPSGEYLILLCTF
ncbi:MAG: IS4/IS5 family transposase, partial [Proteobacteria bacterium]|nr:IS4/IS5 family transposase [Pseudomonadota bacterium]